MKKAKFFRYAALALAAVCALTLAGCPTDSDPDPDPALKGEWTNKVDGLLAGLVKDFTIGDGVRFEAKINPMFIAMYPTVASDPDQLAGLEQTAADTWWTVTGKLTADGGDIYIMSDLTEITGQSAFPRSGDMTAAQELLGFEGHHVKITFNDDKTAFKFESAESGEGATQVDMFFGGNYTTK
jgi:hypothetical protein